MFANSVLLLLKHLLQRYSCVVIVQAWKNPFQFRVLPTAWSISGHILSSGVWFGYLGIYEDERSFPSGKVQE